MKLSVNYKLLLACVLFFDLNPFLNISLVLLRICLFSATLLAVNTKKRS